MSFWLFEEKYNSLLIKFMDYAAGDAGEDRDRRYSEKCCETCEKDGFLSTEWNLGNEAWGR